MIILILDDKSGTVFDTKIDNDHWIHRSDDTVCSRGAVYTHVILINRTWDDLSMNIKACLIPCLVDAPKPYVTTLWNE